MTDFLKQMENMSVEKLLRVYKKAQELIPQKVTPDNFSTVLDTLFSSMEKKQ